MATDYDCWREEEDHVNADMIIKILLENAEKAKNIIKGSITKIDFSHNECGMDSGTDGVSGEGNGKSICSCGLSLQKAALTYSPCLKAGDEPQAAIKRTGKGGSCGRSPSYTAYS